MNNELELGYSCEIALRQLMGLYALSDCFKHDWEYINTKAALSEIYRLEQSLNRESLIDRAFNDRNNFSRLTEEWRHDWEELDKIIADDVKMKVAEIAEKWGPRCDWGCGFIMRPSLAYENEFVLSPGSPNDMVNLSTEVTIFDDIDSFKEKIAELSKETKIFFKTAREHANSVDYRGFERHAKKALAPQVQWLFWHITPPYLNAVEITMRSQNTDEVYCSNEYYIQRCYISMAKLLGISLSKGWTKGRARAKQDTRGRLRRDVIEAKMWLKNDP